MKWASQSPEPTAVGAVACPVLRGSAVASVKPRGATPLYGVHAASRRRFSFLRQASFAVRNTQVKKANRKNQNQNKTMKLNPRSKSGPLPRTLSTSLLAVAVTAILVAPAATDALTLYVSLNDSTSIDRSEEHTSELQ